MKKLGIILDAAHGEDTPGKRSPDGSHREYAWSRKIIDVLLKELERNLFTVKESNPTNVEIGLSTRKHRINEYAKSMKHCFVISLHNNAAGDMSQWMSARGVEIFTTKGETLSDKYATMIMEEIINDFPEMKIRADYWSDGDIDKEMNFTVLMCKPPAVLLEWLFQDNKEDVELLKDDHINARLIKSLVDALIKIDNTL